MKLHNKHIGSTIGIIVGALFILAAFGNSDLSMLPAISAGLLTIFGSLSYRFKKKQVLSKSKRLPILETITIVLFVVHIYFGISTGGWYDNPLYFVGAPVWLIVSYAALLMVKK